MTYRNSTMHLNEVYLWTATIKDWKNLLSPEKYKQLVVDTLAQLVTKKQIRVYGFVIMPNHVHLIWELPAKNGKEMPHASFNKAIGHLIVKNLKKNNPNILPYFEVNERERRYRIWQRDPLAVLMDSRMKVEQKLDYLHLNPLQEKWNLAEKPENYYWSSAKYYETRKDDFKLMTHYLDYF